MVNEPAPAPRLKGWLPMTLGVLGIVIGAVWTLQGLDILTDSKMSGNETWAIVGPIVAAVGLILIVVGVRVRTRSREKTQTD
ncbi:hypothetical protein Ari01nite_01850 [Paractinoplanes rishiriensis]|uniref:Integral membrane protein n=1 Tax=Paractinoplanes rishiriensis TaxID=1050105 RepID=A0A919MUL9_9ACTN|nr:hypothetical protein Ari01nite_01850 [Actinoplanes rishiriensis]